MDNEKKLDQLEEKIKQLQNQKKAILQREKEKERKARTKRLIQIGALFEKRFESNKYSIEVIEEFMNSISAKENGERATEDIKEFFVLAEERISTNKAQKCL